MPFVCSTKHNIGRQEDPCPSALAAFDVIDRPSEEKKRKETKKNEKNEKKKRIFENIYLCSRVLVEHPHDGYFRDRRLSRPRRCTQEHALIAVVQHVEQLRLDGIEVLVPMSFWCVS